jgi:hypothetical protein
MDSAAPPSRNATGYFFFSVVLANAASFLFQVAAGRALSDQDISGFTAWSLAASLWCVPAVAFQYFVSLSRRRLRLSRPALLATAALVATTMVVLAVTFARVNGVAMIMLAFTAQMVSALFVGRLQSEGRIAHLAHVYVIMAVARCAVPVLLGSSVAAWQITLPLSMFASALAGLVVFIARPSAAPLVASAHADGTKAAAGDETKEASLVRRLTGSVLLTSAGLILPFLDFKLIEWTQDVAVSGQFARASTLGRVLYFGGAMLLQVVYPLQLKAGRGEGSPALVRLLKHADWLVLGSLVAGTLVLSGGSSWLVPLMFKREAGVSSTAILVSCLNFSFLVLVFSHVQSCVAKLELQEPLLLSAWLGLSVVALVWFGRGAPPLRVLLGALAVYTVATGFVLYARRRQNLGTASSES